METQSIRYSGSKQKIIDRIIELIPKDVSNILDGFTGSTRVAQALKKKCYNVDTCDLAIYSKVLSNCYIVNNRQRLDLIKIIDHLNSLKPCHGYFSENYGGVGNNSIQKDGKKRIWQMHNANKLDSIREEIDNITDNEIDKSILLTSLMLSLDKVSNDLGHQVSYLKDWSKRSYEKIKLEIPNLIVSNGKYNSYQQDIFNNNNSYDLIYIDPPYGTNNIKTKTTRVRYASYYHLWTTICLNDKPKVVGASNRRYDVSSDSLPNAINVFEHLDYNKVFNSIRELLKLNSKYFIFSYNNKSKIKIDDLIDLFSENNNLIKIEKFKHAENNQKNLTKNKKFLGDLTQNYEYLFLVKGKLFCNFDNLSKPIGKNINLMETL